MGPPLTVLLVDYGAGNLRSISRALRAVGAVPVRSDRPEDRAGCDVVLLPGVGAFGAAMRRLAASGMPEWLRAQVAAGMPLVGVCLGMQLLYEVSEEAGDVRGLAVLPGRVRRLPVGMKVPHMGWNRLAASRPSPLTDGVADGTYVYFVHSYVVDPADPASVAAVASYGIEFPAAVQSSRLVGLQFHPEKSGTAGLRLLRNALDSAVAGWPEGV